MAREGVLYTEAKITVTIFKTLLKYKIVVAFTESTH